MDHQDGYVLKEQEDGAVTSRRRIRGTVRSPRLASNRSSGRPSGRVRRSWVLRLAQPFLPDVDVKVVGQRVEERARDKIKEALGPYYSGDELEPSFPEVKLVVVDAMHALAHIVTRQPEKDITDAGMITIAQVLRGLDEEWNIEGLQGIPKRFWLLLASVDG